MSPRPLARAWAIAWSVTGPARRGGVAGARAWRAALCAQDGCAEVRAQGGDAPLLAGYSAGVDAFLEAMRSTTGDVPEHDLEALGIDLMRRLHTWLKEGANLESGC